MILNSFHEVGTLKSDQGEFFKGDKLEITSIYKFFNLVIKGNKWCDSSETGNQEEKSTYIGGTGKGRRKS